MIIFKYGDSHNSVMLTSFFHNYFLLVLGQVKKGSINATGGPVRHDLYYLYNIVYRVDAVANETRVYGTYDGVG